MTTPTKLEDLVQLCNIEKLSKGDLIKTFNGARYPISSGGFRVCNLDRRSTKDEIISTIAQWQRGYCSMETEGREVPSHSQDEIL